AGDQIDLTVQPAKVEQKKNGQPIQSFELHQNYPNPFNANTTIGFSLPGASFVTLKIFNFLGEEVATLVSKKLSAGAYRYPWNAQEFASGIYMYQIEADGIVQSRKLILLR
ncbi:MAG TPA: T9SS type A sorting domain-containing protein, partial [bacterium]